MTNGKQDLSACVVYRKVSLIFSLPYKKENRDPFCEICLIIQHGLKPIHFKYPDGIFISQMLYTWEV